MKKAILILASLWIIYEVINLLFLVHWDVINADRPMYQAIDTHIAEKYQAEDLGLEDSVMDWRIQSISERRDAFLSLLIGKSPDSIRIREFLIKGTYRPDANTDWKQAPKFECRKKFLIDESNIFGPTIADIQVE
jgi:hypothetical protein